MRGSLTVKRIAVVSQAIKSVGYDAASETLHIEFTTRRVHQYARVPAAVHHALMLAPSKGAFFNEYIRDVYRELRID
jgi:hypothetical protein